MGSFPTYKSKLLKKEWFMVDLTPSASMEAMRKEAQR
jgi:hypothetical protein